MTGSVPGWDQQGVRATRGAVTETRPTDKFSHTDAAGSSSF